MYSLTFRTSIFLALLGLAASAPLDSTLAGGMNMSIPAIHWGPCPGVNLSIVQCGNLPAPLDYGDPHGGIITLAISRIKTNKSSSLGSLHFNPGGPGISGIETIIEFAYAYESGLVALQPDLIENYDIIGLDPRGVGSSTPIQCDPDIYNLRVSTVATDESLFGALKAKNKALGESCRRLSGPVFDHLSTTNVARDFDLARAALGDEKLNLLGLSYGSQLGSQYIELFPERVGRFVLDGIYDHSNGNVFQINTEANGYEETVSRFFIWCDTHASDCAISTGRNMTSAMGNNNTTTTISSPASVWDAIVASASATPILAPGCVSPSEATADSPNVCYMNVTADEFRYTAQDFLFSVNQSVVFNGWAEFSRHLAETAQGNATFFSTRLAVGQNSSLFAENAISLADWPGVRNAEDIKQLLTLEASLYPRTAGFTSSLSLQTQRPGWPANLTNPPHELNRTQVAKAPPVMLVQALWDPACNQPWAQNVRRQLPGSSLVLRNSSGHTSTLNDGAASRAASRFLIEGVLPADGTFYSN